MKKLTREDGASPDLVADNIARLREIFPEIVADGRIDFDALKQALGESVDEREERYSFTWNGKSRVKQIAQTPSIGTLRPCREESVDWETTKNIFIEGDNLEVLKLLQKSYHRKVKMIFIDPPYNTGNEFIYPDKWQDNLDTYLRYTGQVDDEGFKLSANSETSGRYHTNWLNMMYPRLKLARNLLEDTGAIFVTIDDNEQSRLKAVMEEIFGEENFLANFVWQSKDTPGNDSSGVAETHNHVLAYRKTIEFVPTLRPREDKQLVNYKNPDNDPRGDWLAAPLTRGEFRERDYYPIRNPAGEDIYPPDGTCWRRPKVVIEKLLADNRVWWGKSGSSTFPMEKKFLSEAKDGVVNQTWWPYDFAGSTRNANAEIKKIFDGRKLFNTPKPTKLISRIMAMFEGNEGIVLDFFAGSATTADAVIQQNKEDSGTRRYIMIQLPEPCPEDSEPRKAGYENIADIGKERARRISSRVREEQPKYDGDLGFKVFKLSSSNIKPWDAKFDSMDQDLLEAVDNIKPDRSEDDVLYELLLKYGLDLAIPTETRDIQGRKVTLIGAGALIVCLADDITLDVVAGIATLKDELQPEVMRVVFKDAGFADDVAKTNAAQILKQAGIDDVKSL